MRFLCILSFWIRLYEDLTLEIGDRLEMKKWLTSRIYPRLSGWRQRRAGSCSVAYEHHDILKLV